MTTYMHIGAPKTGTTFVQNVLAKNRDLLRSLGVSYPGQRKDHYFAARELLAPITGLEPPAEGAWARTVAEARAWAGETVVISHEHFRHADPPTIERIVAELGPDLRVIITARDVARQVSSLWQESIKNGNTTDFALMLTRLQHQLGEGAPRRLGPMARTIHLANVLEPWRKVMPASAISVVTMPRGRAGELWDRFADVIGVDPSGFDTDVPLNPGMGIGATEFVRRLNESLADKDLAPKDYERLVKHRLAGRMLTQHQDERIVVPAAHHDWLTQWARGQVDALAEAGYRVVGDLEDMVPGPAAEGRDAATEEQVAAAGVYAARGLVMRWAELEARTTPLTPSPAGRARALVRKVRARVRSRRV